jgi:hypothetical protein
MRTTRSLLPLVAALLAPTACGDATTTPAAVQTQSAAPPAPPLWFGSIGARALEIPLGERVFLTGPVYWGYNEDYSDLVGIVDDSSVATWRRLGPQSGFVEAGRAGTTYLTLRGTHAQAKLPVTVLERTSAPAPVVVDFSVIEIQESDQFGYTPQIVVRDTSGRGESAVIGVWFEHPSFGRTQRCAMVRRITRDSTPVFHDAYGDFELWFPAVTGRLSDFDPVIAHVTLRAPGPSATELTVAGRVVRGDWPPYRSSTIADALSCG